MDPALTLNDFRSLLGKVNDGNVVLTADENGVEKVNHGNALTRMVRSYRTAANDEAMNQRVRNLFMQVVQNSQEGKALTQRQLEVFRSKLGVGLDPTVTSKNEFSRTELKLALESLDSMLATGKVPEGDQVVVQGAPDPDLGGLSMMVKRQRELMLNKGLNNDAYKHIMTRAENAIKLVPCLSSPADMVAALPKKLHGHTRDELKKFVKNNFHLVQSQVFDRLVWAQGDASKRQLNLPQDQRGERLNLDAREVLLNTISDMMQTYGARQEPTPRAEKLLAQVPSEPMPEEVQVKTAFEAFRARTDALMNVMFKSDAESSLFDQLQLAFSQRRMQAALDRMFVHEFVQAEGAAEDKSRVAESKVLEFAADFFNANVVELKRLMSDPTAAQVFRAELFAQLGQKGAVSGDGVITDDRLRTAFRGAFAALTRAADLSPVVEAYVRDSDIPESRRAEAVAQLSTAVRTADGIELHMLFADMRLGLLKERAENNGTGLTDKATQLKNDAPAFKAFAEGVLADFVDPAEIRRKRSAMLAQLPGIHPPWERKPEKTFFDTYRTLFGDAMSKFETSLASEQLSPEERKKRLEKFDALLKDPEFRGSIILVGELFPNEYNHHFGTSAGFGTTCEQIDANVQWVKSKVDPISLKELQFYFPYVKLGLSSADNMLSVATTAVVNPFRGMLLDGTIDFASLGQKSCKYLVEQLQVAMRPSLDPGYMSTGTDIPDDILPAFKAASNQAVQTLESEGLDDAGDLVERFYGFGTAEPARVMQILASAGLALADLDTPEGLLKIHRLSLLIGARGGRGDGVVEWAERVTGKAFDAITLVDCGRLLYKRKNDEAIPDPADKLSGNQLSVANFLGGNVSTGDAGLVPSEMKKLLEVMRAFESGGAQRTELVLFGQTVVMERRASGTLTARLASGSRLSLPVARTAEGLIRQIQDHMVDNVGAYGAEFVAANLPALPKPTEVVARARELYSKTLASVLGLPSVNFAHLSTVELERTARQALANPQALQNRFVAPPTTYSSAETVELQEKLLRADRMDLARIVMPAVAPTRTMEEREAQPPTREGVHNLVADLLMNRDTWAFDVGRANPGQRLHTLLAGYGPELRFICGQNGAALLDTLPEVVREPMRGIFRQLGAINLGAPNAREQLAAVEAQLDTLVNTAMDTMQAKATQLFAAQQGVQGELWQQSLGGMVGNNGLDVSTPAGRFTKAVLDNYFHRSDGIEKRAMLASMVRGTDANSGDGRLVAEMLKGAGPLLQKTLQGLPIETFGPETQLALKDMKSKLLPIPDNVIKAQLLEMLRSSGGEILSIEVKQSFGQATVGQALLCHVRTKKHPVNGEDVVVKLLRPNVQTAIQREHELFMAVARELDQQAGPGVRAQQLTFQGQYESILKEFDFTIEADNIDRCLKIYDKPMASFDENKTQLYVNVHSMDRVGSVPAMTGMLVLEKVDGNSADRLLERTSERAAALIAEVDPNMRHDTRLPPGDQVRTTWETDSMEHLILAKYKLRLLRRELIRQQRNVCQLLDIWLQRALFGDGSFHNDLHAGNIMVKDDEVTAIDFGNVMRLSKTQQDQLVLMFSACIRATPDGFLKALGKLLPMEMSATFNGVKARLTDDLGEVFAKGTANDVLPRLMAALAVVQRAGVPVPDTVQNFVQSMSRIQSVVGAFEMRIREVEDISGRVMFTRQVGENLVRPIQNLPQEAAGLRELFNGLNQIVLSYGDAGGAVEPIDGYGLASRLFEEFGRLKAEKPSGQQEVVDPLDHVKREERPQLFSVCEDFEKHVFTRQDGGVALLREVADRYAFIASMGIRQAGNGGFLFTPWNSPFEAVRRRLDEYEQMMQRNDVDEQALKKERRELLRAFCFDIYMISDQAGRIPSQGVITDPEVLPEFVDVVGDSLMNRSTDLAHVFGDDIGISREKFDDVMEAASNGAGDFAIMLKAGKDLLKFRDLRNIATGIVELRNQGVEHKESVEAARKQAETANAALPANERLSFRRMRQLAAAAHDFLMPKGWKPSFKNAQGTADEKGPGMQLFRDVLETNLAALRRSLNAQALTRAELQYFARVLAAETEKTGLREFIRGTALIDEFIADELQQAENNVAGADRDLASLVSILRQQE